MRIGKIASSAEYRVDEQFQNFPTFAAKFWLYKFKKFWKFFIFRIFKILKISQILQFQKYLEFHNSKNVPNFTISKIVKFSLLTNS